jgi:ABC-type transport system involved in cytochrome c biogenesis permease subunit
VLLAQIVKASLPSTTAKTAIAATSLAAVAGVVSYLPYRFDQIDTAAFRNRLDRFDPIDLAEGLTNYRMEAIQANSRRLRRKARGVRVAAVPLLTTVATISGSILGVWTSLHDVLRTLPWP